MEDYLLSKVKFFRNCTSIKQELSGYSSALRYICELDDDKYFVKIYSKNNLKQIKQIDLIYKKLNIPTPLIIYAKYLNDLKKTLVIYEYIDGKEIYDLTKELSVKEIEKIGFKVGKNLAKFKKIKCNKQELINSYDKEFNKLADNLYIIKDFYEKNENKKLYSIDLDKLYNTFLEHKKYVYNSEPSFIHGDINLHNVIVKNKKPYFIDTSNGKNGFRSLDFRGNCWFGWDGDNKFNEQAMFRGIYKGLFNGKIPDEFHKELAFTIIYEFFLKINEGYKKKDMGKIEYNFYKFGKMFDMTNYFENYKFKWFE